MLFTLISARLAHRSLGITSNLVFSEWEELFTNPMATSAPIDGIVRHSVILQFHLPSHRANTVQGPQLQVRQLQTTVVSAKYDCPREEVANIDRATPVEYILPLNGNLRTSNELG